MILAVRCSSCGTLRPADAYIACRRCAVERVRQSFQMGRVHASVMLGGLARVYTRYAAREMFDADSPLAILNPSTPWGWRWQKVEYRDARVLMPLWLYWPRRAWEYRYEWVFRPLRALGLWRVREGDYWWDGTLTAPRWLRHAVVCFLRDRDHCEAR